MYIKTQNGKDVTSTNPWPISVVGSLTSDGSTSNGLFVGGAVENGNSVVHKNIAMLVDGDNTSNPASIYMPTVIPFNLLFVGNAWARERGNTEGTLLASAARTASVNSNAAEAFNGSKLAVYLDVTAVSGTSPTLDVKVTGRDTASGKYFTIGTFAQKTAVGSEAIFIGGGADIEFAVRAFRVECTIGGTTPSFTFSVGYSATVS